MTSVGDGMPEVSMKVVTHILSVPTIPVSHGEKLKKFNGSVFKRWQQKYYSI